MYAQRTLPCRYILLYIFYRYPRLYVGTRERIKYIDLAAIQYLCLYIPPPVYLILFVRRASRVNWRLPLTLFFAACTNTGDV